MASEVVKRPCKQVQNKSSQSNHKNKCGHCGISELWYLSMIQCSACQQWFHEGCVKCLSHPLVLGDCFYIFVCSSCNFGVEYVSRLQLTWLELAHLVLFHLMIKYRGSYFDVDAEILPWVKDHWESLQTGLMNDVSDEERRKEFIDALNSNSNRFRGGHEVRRKKSLWTLRVCCPPTAPKYQLFMSDRALTDSAVNHFLASEPRFIDRNEERLQRVRRVLVNYPQKDEYYEKWMKCRSECKKSRRKKPKNQFDSVPKRKAALECREKCKKLVQRQSIREMPTTDGWIQSAGSCISKRKVNRASSCRISPDVDKDSRSLGRGTISWDWQPLERNAEEMSSGAKRLRKQGQARPSLQILEANQDRKRESKTLASNDFVVEKRRRGRPRLGSSSDAILWTHELMANVENAAAERHGRNNTQMEFTLLMARRIPLCSKTVADVREYFKDTSNLAAREGCSVMGRRVSPDGVVQYLVVRNEPINSLL